MFRDIRGIQRKPLPALAVFECLQLKATRHQSGICWGGIFCRPFMLNSLTFKTGIFEGPRKHVHFQASFLRYTQENLEDQEVE